MTIRRPCLSVLTALLIGLGACSGEPTTPLVEAAKHAPAAAGPAGQRIPNRYIVVFREGMWDAPRLARRLTATHGGELHHTYRHALQGFAATLSAPAVEALRRNPNVAYVEADQVAMLSQTTQTGATWGIDRVDQRFLPLNGTYRHVRDGGGINVYVIDSGIQTTHAEFGGRASVGFDATGGNGLDCNGHGTHVAGTIGGTTFGVAKAANLIAVRVGQCGNSMFVADIIAGIDWVRGNRQLPAVANLSLEGSPSTAMDDALRSLIASGVTAIVAAGNTSSNACLVSPARVAEAITVGATNASDQQASFSNFGSCLDLYAPGEAITSAGLNGVPAVRNGTSMAAPHVTGAAVLYLQKYPGSTPAQVQVGILSNSTPGRLSSLGTGSPNRLANSLFDSEGTNRRAMHRLYKAGNGDHMYGHYPSEGYQWGYTAQNVDYFHLAAAPAANHVPLYRCYAYPALWSYDHFLSTDPGCEGTTNEGLMGYIATSQVSGTVALHRLYKASTGDNLYTTSSVEVSRATMLGTEQNRGIVGYVYSQP